MDGGHLLALEQARPVLIAEEELKGPVADERVYDVVLAAYGDEEMAWAARNTRIADRLRAKETPQI